MQQYHILSLMFLMPLVASFSMHQESGPVKRSQQVPAKHSDLMAATLESVEINLKQNENILMPKLGQDGLYHITNPEEYK